MSDTRAPSSSSSGAPYLMSADALFGPGVAYIQPGAPAPDAGTTDYTHGDPSREGNWLCECGQFCHRRANDLEAELSRLRSSCNTSDSNELGGLLAERHGAEPDKTREIL